MLDRNLRASEPVEFRQVIFPFTGVCSVKSGREFGQPGNLALIELERLKFCA
jgi:hypothetical protein